jgi:hypothetical protein
MLYTFASKGAGSSLEEEACIFMNSFTIYKYILHPLSHINRCRTTNILDISLPMRQVLLIDCVIDDRTQFMDFNRPKH